MFGTPSSRRVPSRPTVDVVQTKEADTDGDGIVDRLDLCPKEKGTGGCPEADPDGDGIVGDKDKCPLEPEDVDGFQDADGCPDPDNDGDGIEDTRDGCPNEPETKNGVDDSDGCPDSVPDNVAKALAVGTVLKFEPNRARVSPLAVTVLKPLHLMLLAHPDVAIRITGIPDKAGAGDLAHRRADAVKWYLVDQGITENRIETATGTTPAKPGGPVIELSLRIK
jgi:outer membrane protein OmpA-like peptidoglycan-associated protein